MQSLLYQGANPNFILEKGVAAVHLAVGKESEKGIRCLKLILQHGADPNLRLVRCFSTFLYSYNNMNTLDILFHHVLCVLYIHSLDVRFYADG